MSGRGGRREGAGRPRGSGKYGEPTKAVRIPKSMAECLPELIDRWQASRSSPRSWAAESGKVFRLAEVTQRPLRLFDTPAAAGNHSMMSDFQVEEAMDLNSYFSQRSQETFLVKVTGNSMVDAQIYEDDLLVVEPTEEANNGDIVLAYCDDRPVVKRLHKDGKEISLLSENPDYEPIPILEGTTFHIFGKVTGTIRRFDGKNRFLF